jgi:hypothetical protein
MASCAVPAATARDRVQQLEADLQDAQQQVARQQALQQAADAASTSSTGSIVAQLQQVQQELADAKLEASQLALQVSPAWVQQGAPCFSSLLYIGSFCG